jgi:hypothetical protein
MLRGAMPAQAEQDAAASPSGEGVGSESRDTQDGVAAPLRESGELMHFCSAACRDKYVSGSQRMAANG